MKKIALISSFCDTEEKQRVLIDNVKKLKHLNLDVLVISPIELPYEIIKLCDYFFYTKDNELLKWPIRMYTHWYEVRLFDGRITTLQRGLADYGWAGLHQVKKLSQISLTFNYDIFYHMIYDLVIDENVEREINSNNVNIVFPRRDPSNSDILWETTLHFMIFDREMMEKVEKEITLDEYLRTNGMAEGEVLKWKNKFNIKGGETPVKDQIFYWGNYDFFNYSPFEEFKMFISKNEKMNVWLGEDPIYETELTDNLRICFHSFDNIEKLEIDINGVKFIETPKNWEFIEYPISSQNIQSLIFTFKGKVVDFTKEYEDIMMNQIYYNHRP